MRPAWLRPFVGALAITAHIAVLGGFARSADDKITPLSAITVDIVPEGETVTETSEAPTLDAASVVATAPPVLAAPDPQTSDHPEADEPVKEVAQAAPVPDVALPPPKIESPDAPPVAIERPQPERLIEEKKPDPAPVQPAPKVQEQKVVRPIPVSRAAMLAVQRAKAEAHARNLGERAQLGAPARRAGVESGSGDAPSVSRSGYAALVSAEINRHKLYPASARAAGAEGSVAMVFTIGATGAIVSHAITRSSGYGALDAAADQMMATSNPPPPPDGAFHGQIAINFRLSN
ncbi:MAG: energy transducer TonB [Roseiarcus sp.]